MTIEEFYGQSIGVKTPWRVINVSIHPEAKEVRITVQCASGETWIDPQTGRRAEIKDWHERTWRHLDTCEFTTVVSARVPRVKLSDGSTMMVHVPWAEPGGRFTRAFESHLIRVLDACRTVRGAALLARVSEVCMEGVMRRAVARGLERRDLGSPRYLGIDEKAARKGHRYVSVLNDLDLGRVLEVVEARTQEAATTLLQSLPEASRESVQAVAMDMWPAYLQAMEQVLPKAIHVFDPFHVSKHLNEAVDKVRRREHRELSAGGDETLKKTKYLWLRERVDLRTRTGIEFRELLNEDLATAAAWGLKQNFRRFWSYESWGRACGFLERWVEAAVDSGLQPMIKMAAFVEKHAEGLLNHVHHPISNGGSEGINSSIQSLKHLARGLPKFATLRTRILFFLGMLDRQPA